MLHSDLGCGFQESEYNLLPLCYSNYTLRLTLCQAPQKVLGIQGEHKDLAPSIVESTSEG